MMIIINLDTNSKISVADKRRKIYYIGITSKILDEYIDPTCYANLVYDGFGSMLLLFFKSIKKKDLDLLKNDMDYEYINSFEYPAAFEYQKYIIDDSSVNGKLIKDLYFNLLK